MAEACYSKLSVKGKAPHVLLIPYPCQGHINPLLELGKRLASLGLTTSFATLDAFVGHLASSSPPSSSPGIPQAELRVASHDNSSFVSVFGVPDGLPLDCERREFSDSRLFAAIQHKLEGALCELVHSLSQDGRPITCLVGDFFLPWMPHLAHVLHLPEVVFWPMNASCFAIYSHVDQIISNGYNPFKGNVNAFGPHEALDLVTCIPGLPSMHPSELPFQLRFNDYEFTWLETLLKSRFDKIHQALLVLGNSFKELEPNVCNALGSKFYGVGPLIRKGDVEKGDSKSCRKWNLDASLWEEDDCIDWLDEQPPKSVVYVSFGSVTKYSVTQIQELARGLAASNQRFLWVIRKNMVVEELGNVTEALPEGFLDKVKGKGKVINWAPQALVLAHPSVGGFFSHCGWSSCMESFSCGIPMLGWPFVMDQVTNCWLVCKEWKVGLQVGTDHEGNLDHSEVERCLRRLMEGEEAQSMRARATALQQVAQQSLLSTCGSSLQNLKHLVDLINHLST